MNYISRNDLIEKISLAQNRIRFLGVLAINLDWQKFSLDWLKRINDGTLNVEIIREAEHFVSNSSIISSNRRLSKATRSYQMGNLKKVLEAPLFLRKYLIDNGCRHIEPVGEGNADDTKQCFSLRTCYLNIPISIVNIDDDYYAHIPISSFVGAEEFQVVDENHFLFHEMTDYINIYFDNPEGAKLYSTEVTKKGNRLEVINAYNSDREIIFPLPRDSFPDTKFAKLVVWALIFTRDGKLLLHRRGLNAKDNQGMWDKSVGGHVSVDDIDTVKAISREMAEELFKHEQESQGGHDETDFLIVNEDKMIFLGEWNPKKRSLTPFDAVNNQQGENFFFRLDYDFSKRDQDTRRLLKNGDTVIAHTFIDLYVCIVSDKFSIDGLANSEYMLVELHDLYDAYLEKVNPIKSEDKFEVTPDLESILRSTKLFDELNEFADYIKDAGKGNWV
jgi:hypothetical protein